MHRHTALPLRFRITLPVRLALAGLLALTMAGTALPTGARAMTVHQSQVTGCFAPILTYSKTIPVATGTVAYSFGTLGISVSMDGASNVVTGLDGSEPAVASCVAPGIYPADASSFRSTLTYNQDDGTTSTCVVDTTNPSYAPTLTVGPFRAPDYPMGILSGRDVSAGRALIEGVLFCTNTSNPNIHTRVTFVSPVPDLTVSLTPQGTFTPGGSAGYIIQVNNAGGATTTGSIFVTDTFPTGETPTAVSVPRGYVFSIVGQTLSLTRTAGVTGSLALGAIPAGGSDGPITVTLSIAPNATSPLTNTARTFGGGESNTTNNTATDTQTFGAVSTGGGAATPELGSAELLMTGLLPLAALAYAGRRRARRR